MNTTKCDQCGGAIRDDGVHYALGRYDQHGYLDALDLCSTKCLSLTALDDAHMVGAVVGDRSAREAVDRKMARAPRRVRKWWMR